MQRQKVKFIVAFLSVMLLNLPTLNAAKHRKQGASTTRGTPAPTHAPAPTSAPAPPPPAPNNDATKLSYGNQGPPPAYNNAGHPAPPPYSPNPPQYGGGGQSGYHPQPGYQSQPGGQPVYVNHVQQPQQGGGGLGVGSGLAIGKKIISSVNSSNLIIIHVLKVLWVELLVVTH